MSGKPKIISSSVGRPLASPETLPEKKLGTFSRAELVSGVAGEGDEGDEGVGRETGARFGDRVIEWVEGGGVGVDALGPLKKPAVWERDGGLLPDTAQERGTKSRELSEAGLPYLVELRLCELSVL